MSVAPKLLRTWRWRFFWLSLLPTLRLPLSLAAVSSRRRATGLPLLRRLVLLWRRRLTMSALHSFSLGGRRTRGSATRRRVDRLPNSSWRTGSTLLMFSCAQRRRRAEPLTLESSLVTLRRSLSCSTMRRTTMLLLLLRRCTLET